jgi:hypothetical protein
LWQATLQRSFLPDQKSAATSSRDRCSISPMRDQKSCAAGGQPRCHSSAAGTGIEELLVATS